MSRRKSSLSALARKDAEMGRSPAAIADARGMRLDAVKAALARTQGPGRPRSDNSRELKVRMPAALFAAIAARAERDGMTRNEVIVRALTEYFP